MIETLYKYFLFSLLITVLTSCSLFKTNVKKDIEERDSKNYNETDRIDKNALAVKDSLYSNSLSFNTFSAGFSGSYQSKEQNLPLKGHIRIKKDQFIWISLRPMLNIEIGRILFTEDSIKYLDRMKKEYFAENYNYIKKHFGFKMNYSIIESVLTNTFFLYPPDNSEAAYFLIENESTGANTLNAVGIYSDINLSHNIMFSGHNYYITENKINLLDNNKKVIFYYSNFKVLNNTEFPSNVLVNIFDNSKESLIDLEYSGILINKEFDLNFKIPSTYKQRSFD